MLLIPSRECLISLDNDVDLLQLSVHSSANQGAKAHRARIPFVHFVAALVNFKSKLAPNLSTEALSRRFRTHTTAIRTGIISTGPAAAAARMDRDSASERPPNPQTQSIFFTLSPELRQEIYRLVFDIPLNIFGRVRLSDPFNPPDKPTVLSILQTCSLIRNEAEDLFYHKYHLEIVEWSGACHTKMLVKDSNPHRLAAIRKLTVLIPHLEHIPRVFRMAHYFTGLEELSVAEAPDQKMFYCSLQDLDRELPFIMKATKHLPITLAIFNLSLVKVAYFQQVQAWTAMVQSLVMNSIEAKRRKQAEFEANAEAVGGPSGL